MATNNQLAKIHIAKKDLDLDDYDYRFFLRTETGKSSAKLLTEQEATSVLDMFKRLGWTPKTSKPKSKKYEDLANRDGMASPKQLRMIEAMWMTGSNIREKNPAALRSFLNHKFGISDLRFIEDNQVGRIVRSIKSINQGSEHSSDTSL